MIESILYILTFSLQFMGMILLVDRFIGFSKKKIIYKHLNTSVNYLKMKNGKTVMKKNDYINIVKSMILSLYATLYTIVGLGLTIFDFKCTFSNLDKIYYSIKIMFILFIIKYLTEKIVLLIFNKKYKYIEEIEIENDEAPEGAIAFEIEEDK